MVISSCVLQSLKGFCTAKSVQTSNFPCWEDEGTFKAKYAVNTEYLICNLHTGPLINCILKGRRAMLKERAFEQCKATYIG